MRAWLGFIVAIMIFAGTPPFTRARAELHVGESADKVIASYYFGEGDPSRVAEIPAEKLTHLIYAFATLCGEHPKETAETRLRFSEICAPLAPFAAFFPTDGDWEGELRALTALKEREPHLKFFLSIGGWGLSAPFHDMIVKKSARRSFALSSIELLERHSLFDGLDIDWEYPGGGDNTHPRLDEAGVARERAGYRLLMKELRARLNDLSKKTGRDYSLSAAVNASDKHIDSVRWDKTIPYMDYIFVMTYDFAVADGEAGHHANLYGRGGLGADRMVENLINAGAPVEKIVLGVPFYARGWSGVSLNADGSLGGVDTSKIIADADRYRRLSPMDLAEQGFIRHDDDGAGAAFLYNDETKEFISFDDAATIRRKARWARERGLAGLFSWQILSDVEGAPLTGAMTDSGARP